MRVKSQLSEQSITFATAGSGANTGLPAKDQPFIARYARQQMPNGRQSEVYTYHFTAVHLSKIPAGTTYSEVSAVSQADPANAALSNQVQLLSSVVQ